MENRAIQKYLHKIKGIKRVGKLPLSKVFFMFKARVKAKMNLKTKLASIVLVVLLSSCFYVSFQPVHAQSEPSYTLKQVAYGGSSMVKPAILNGDRYVFINEGWGSAYQSPIQIYAADSNWNTVSLLNTTTTAYSDFYVYTFPQLWNDTIIFCGSVEGPSGDAFIGSYNITSNAYNIVTLANAGYITQVVYVSSLGEFVIMPADGASWQNYVITCSPNNLLNTDSWVFHGPFSDPTFGGDEKMFTYFQGSGWMIRWNSAGNSQLIQWNMTDDSYIEPFNSTDGYLIQARQYISSNSTTMFFSVVSGETEEYYYTNDGSVFVNFLSLPAALYSGETDLSGDGENHAPIYPLTSQYVLIGDICDGCSASYYALVTTSGNIIGRYFVTTHYSENTPLTDGNNYVLGGEGYASSISILAPSQINETTTSNTNTPDPVMITPSPTPSPTPTSSPITTTVPVTTPAINEGKENLPFINEASLPLILAITIAMALTITALVVYGVRKKK